jgi:hypothetical protein
MKNILRPHFLLFLSIFTLGFLSGCSNSGSSGSNSAVNATATNNLVSKYDLNIYPVNKLVCDPLVSTAPNPAINGGLRAALYYLQSGQPRYSDVSDFFANAYKADQTLFLTNLNVPTRNFTEGFSIDDNELVTDDQNNTLLEWFGLHFEANLGLAADQPEGYYQFALLADDGAILQMSTAEGNWQTVVNNDGLHQTQMGCSTQTVYLTHASQIPIQVSYFQGPRYQIALTLMMRLVSDPNSIPAESLCGQSGNYLFFNPDTGSSPQPAYTQLLGDGWTTLEPSNFTLFDKAIYNPCVAGQNPVISNIQVSNVTSTSFEMTWTTDIASSSQVMTQQGSNPSTLTISDNVLRTSHDVIVQSLSANTAYSAQPVSISDSFGKTIGTAQTVQTTP